MEENDFKKDLVLNKNMLDFHALEQPELYGKWASEWANAVLKREQAKDRLNLARAECDEIIRKDPKDYGWDSEKSPTEKFIEAKILTHKKYTKALQEYQEAAHDANVMGIAKDSIEMRGKSLDMLTRLFAASYFSTKPAERFERAAPEANSEFQKEGLQQTKRKLLTRKTDA